MSATGVKILMDDDTKLSDLLALNLHNYEDEVKNIVDKAEKEGEFFETTIFLLFGNCWELIISGIGI